jgi:hypothetical protein
MQNTIVHGNFNGIIFDTQARNPRNHYLLDGEGFDLSDLLRLVAKSVIVIKTKKTATKESQSKTTYGPTEYFKVLQIVLKSLACSTTSVTISATLYKDVTFDGDRSSVFTFSKGSFNDRSFEWKFEIHGRRIFFTNLFSGLGFDDAMMARKGLCKIKQEVADTNQELVQTLKEEGRIPVWGTNAVVVDHAIL